MSKPHIFNLFTDVCHRCGMSRQEMMATQAMDSCPVDKPVYIKARMNERTMEIEVVDRGIWIPLDTYRKQRGDKGGETVSLTNEEICKIIRENWRFPPDWKEHDPEIRQIKPREMRCVTYNIPAGVIYFFPKEADAIDFSKDRIVSEMPWKSGVEMPGAKYTLLESIPESEAEGMEKCKHDGHYGFDSLLQRCRDCGMSAIDIEIEQRPNNLEHKSEKPISQIEQVPVKEQEKNYCSPGDVFSQCKAGMSWKDHQKCRFSEKASRASRCMYFRNLNGTKHCDNHLAQKALYLSANDNRLVPNE